MGRPKGKSKKFVCMDTIDLLQIRTLKAAAQKEKMWKWGIGKAKVRKRAEVSQTKEKNEMKFVSKLL